MVDVTKTAPVVGVLTMIRQQPPTRKWTMVVGIVWQNWKQGVEGGMLCKEGRRVEIEMGVTTKMVVVKIHWAGVKVVDISKRAPVGGVLIRLRQQATGTRTIVLGIARQNQQAGEEGGERILWKKGAQLELLVAAETNQAGDKVVNVISKRALVGGVLTRVGQLEVLQRTIVLGML